MSSVNVAMENLSFRTKSRDLRLGQTSPSLAATGPENSRPDGLIGMGNDEIIEPMHFYETL